MSMHPLEYFDRIHIINLRSRADRREDLLEQFSAMKFSAANVQWFDAIKPDEKGPFQSIGARGCFLSHLEVLKAAEQEGVERLLILEDDAGFPTNFSVRMAQLIHTLDADPWDMFYGGGRVDDRSRLPLGVALVEADCPIGCTHFVAVHRRAIPRLRAYLEAQITRPAGDPAGGPMPVDGSYFWARRELNLRTLIANPDACFQRSSRSDITPRPWDRFSGLRGIAAALRKLKNAN